MSYIRRTIDVEGKEVVFGITPTLLNGVWNIVGKDNEDEALLEIGRVIIANHDYSKPLESQYLFTSDNSERSIDRMLDWLKRNKL